MKGKRCTVSRMSTDKPNATQNLGKKLSAIHTLPDTSSISPFAQGARVRPRNPWHLWRQYPVIVEESYLACTIWLITVKVYAELTFLETVLASDFEWVGAHPGIKLRGL